MWFLKQILFSPITIFHDKKVVMIIIQILENVKL